MENWFRDNPFLRGEYEQNGIEFTNLLKERGFVSREEYSAYAFVDQRIRYSYFGVRNNEMQELKSRHRMAITKQQKYDFINQLGMLDLLNHALSMTEDELFEEQKQFEKENWIELSKRGKTAEQMLDEQIENYKSRH